MKICVFTEETQLIAQMPFSFFFFLQKIMATLPCLAARHPWKQLSAHSSLKSCRIRSSSLAPAVSYQRMFPSNRQFSRTLSSSPRRHNAPLHSLVWSHKDKLAITDVHGSHTFSSLLSWSSSIARSLRPHTDSLPGDSAPHIAVMSANNAVYVAAQWAVWSLGYGIVPLIPSYPTAQLEYFLIDSQADVILVEKQFQEKLKPLARKLNRRLVVLPDKETGEVILVFTFALFFFFFFYQMKGTKYLKVRDLTLLLLSNLCSCFGDAQQTTHSSLTVHSSSDGRPKLEPWK